MERRNFLTGIGAFLAAPAIIRTPGLLMPIRPYRLITYWMQDQYPVGTCLVPIDRWDWQEPPRPRSALVYVTPPP